MSNINIAMNAVMSGPQKKRLKVRGHHWNFKKAKRNGINRQQGTGTIEGTISHNVRFVDDEQVKYEITFLGRKKDGELKKPKIEIKIKNSLWGGITSEVAGAAVTFFSGGNVLAGRATDLAAQEIFKRVHGGWRGVAEGLVTIIAIRAASQLFRVSSSRRRVRAKPGSRVKISLKPTATVRVRTSRSRRPSASRAN